MDDYAGSLDPDRIAMLRELDDGDGELMATLAHEYERVAGAHAHQCRVNERAYGYGGEEFVIVYSDEAPTGAAVAGERLRIAVEALAIPHASKTPPVMTISVGLATFDPNIDRDSDPVLKKADAALYLAQERGRNRVVSYGLCEPAVDPPLVELHS